MSHGQNPLVLMLALSLPGAAHALGLGDIHVDSKLNEPLAAEIDIVGATAEELAALRAAVANRETFLRYGVERPAFLSSATFKVSHDALGHPVLAVRSSDSFTEPLVNFLVDLRWNKGELIREYTLLLDPAVFAAANRAQETTAAPTAQEAPAAQTAGMSQIVPALHSPTAAPIAPANPTAAIESTQAIVPASVESRTTDQTPPSARHSDRKVTQYKVGAKATLRGIAWRAGARSESDLQRLMLAIFRANPHAFQGNINRLHLGALINIPGAADVSAISKAEANHEIQAQMAAWHAPGRAAEPKAAIAAKTPVGVKPAAMISNDAAARAPALTESQALSREVQSMEQQLHELQRQLEGQHDKMLGMQLQVGRAQQSVAPAETAHAQSKFARASLPPILAGLALLAAACSALYLRLRRRATKSIEPRRDLDPAGANRPRDAQPLAAMQVSPVPPATNEISRLGAEPGAMQARHLPDETTVNLQIDAAMIQGYTVNIEGDTVNSRLDAASLDDTVNNRHDMPGVQDDTVNHRPEVRGVEDDTVNRRPEVRGVQDDTVNLRGDTVNLPIDTLNLRVDAVKLDYNLLDLDLTAQQHVHMPSALNENAVMKERRTNFVDVLRLAIEREPDRHDLRLKLLELYYTAAATNRSGFLEVVQKFARERDYLADGEWDKIAYMGRQIASENPLFAEETASDDELADCA